MADIRGVSYLSYNGKFDIRYPVYHAIARIRNGINSTVLDMNEVGWFAQVNMDGLNNLIKRYSLSLLAISCNTKQCAALQGNAKQRKAMRSNTKQREVPHSNAKQRTAM